jgi:hypothetical protein
MPPSTTVPIPFELLCGCSVDFYPTIDDFSVTGGLPLPLSDEDYTLCMDFACSIEQYGYPIERAVARGWIQKVFVLN